ncbi:MAG: hypothetical protein ABFD96_11550 [Armatimonadia bacterium]
MTSCRPLILTALGLLLLGPVAAQKKQDPYNLPPGHHIPGRPWTSIIPDPDKYNWNATGARPGYEYRGMLPLHQRFYDYIQRKRAANQPLTWADQSTIRWLITCRRWPEAPRPNAFWAAYMRYLRSLPNDDLNTAQNVMLSELMSRGLVPVDMIPDERFQNIHKYLTSGPFRARNWFERTFGRIEPWMDNLAAGWGYDLRTSAPSGNSFPAGDPFNGLKITYNVAGATLGAPVDTEGFTISRSFDGVLGTGTLAISGSVRVGGYGADVSLSVWAGDKKEEKKFYVENVGSSGNPTNFNLSVPIPANARSGGFAMRLDGRYSMGGGHRGCYVTGSLGPSKEQIAADQAAADAKWRQEVEDTLARLGYQNTPEGKELEEMRKALAGGDAAWKAYVDSRREAMKGPQPDTPEMREYNELHIALNAPQAKWDAYVAKHLNGSGGGTGGGTTPATGGGTPATGGGSTSGGGTGGQTSTTYQPPADIGGMKVGTGASGGQVTNPANSFEAPRQVSCALDFTNIPANSVAVATWSRNGQQLMRSERQIGGDGWVSFSLLGGGNQPLSPGVYTVTVTVGDKILGRKSFTIRGGAVG